jgi:hypothetical protein
MTITLELTDEEEQAIERKARRLGLTSSEYMRRMAQKAATPRGKASQPEEIRPQTPADFLDKLKAENFSFGYGDPAVDAPELARQLRERFSRPNRETAE